MSTDSELELRLESRGSEDKTIVVGNVMATPPIDSDYWEYRVRLTDEQSIVGFHKFTTIGIGFAVEEDWNTNLPFWCETKEIRKHIWHNRGDKNITKAQVDAAIRLIQDAAILAKPDQVHLAKWFGNDEELL